jgi:hypothetical protein
MYFLFYQRTATMSIYKPLWLSDKTLSWSYSDTGLVGIGSRRVFGLSKPRAPDQYMFAFVPRNAVVLGLVDSAPTPSSLFESQYRNFTPPVSTPKLSSSFNLVKGMVALLQSIYASSTLIRTDGGEVKRYGFAAPGLTVLPYAVMSTLNLMASLLAPHYPTLYLVRSEVMEEAERRTGLAFHYVVGRLVDESGASNIVMEGWSEIAGSFKDNDRLLSVSPSAEEDEIEICNSSYQTIYVPSCPRFRRTDDSQTFPLRQFIESRNRLVFSQQQYMLQRLQASMHPSLRYHPPQGNADAILPQLLWESRFGRSMPNYARLVAESRSDQEDPLAHELLTTYTICFAEFFATLVLSRFNTQQSTLAQRAWTITWLFMGSLGAMISQILKVSRSILCFVMVIYGVPAIGGFVVVCQMLKAYGICYKTI